MMRLRRVYENGRRRKIGLSRKLPSSVLALLNYLQKPKKNVISLMNVLEGKLNVEGEVSLGPTSALVVRRG